MKSRLLLFCTCFIALVKAQVPYNHYIGAGHAAAIIVTSGPASTESPHCHASYPGCIFDRSHAWWWFRTADAFAAEAP